MAVAPTGDIYKALSFDNVSSRTYGVYITGSAVYNAPEREVEMISIPGRNGALALDKGRFENIEVTYPAGIFADTEADFAQAVSEFRNFLCSKKGYCRLSDDYNPSEYRMAVYKSGLEVSPAQLKAGEFDITFECQPQRFLTSGETEQTVSNNGTLTNPTLFAASPLLKVVGYGDVKFNGYTITLTDEQMGRVVLDDEFRYYPGTDDTFTMIEQFDSNYVNTGDSIKLNEDVTMSYDTEVQASMHVSLGFRVMSAYTIDSWTETSSSMTHYNCSVSSTNDHLLLLDAYLMPANFTAGTSSNVSGSYAVTVTLKSGSTTVGTATFTITETVSYNGNNQITASFSVAVTGACASYWLMTNSTEVVVSRVVGNSTLSVLGNPTYINCDIGEAYKILSNKVIPINKYIALGSDLPKLKPGTNTFTKSNTVTSLKVVPNWWKV